MPILEDAKKTIEQLTGYRRPARRDIASLVRTRKANLFCFRDDGATPNNPRLAMILYRSPVKLDGDLDPAAIFEGLFRVNDWNDSWRDGVYNFLHFHTG